MNTPEKLLKKHKLKVTSCRLAVLEYLEVALVPADSGEIIAYIEKKNIHADRATVFRTLAVFKGAGMIKAVQLNESKQRYELASAPEHHHIVCVQCGNIVHVAVCIDKRLEKIISNSTGYILNAHTLEFTGICPQCQ